MSGVFPTAFLLSSLANLLCEDEWVEARAAPEKAGLAGRPALRRLLPPYGSLLRRWVRPDGLLSISSSTGTVVGRTVQTLLTLQENWERLDETVARASLLPCCRPLLTMASALARRGRP